MDYLSQEIKLKKIKIDDFKETEENFLGEGASGKVYSYVSPDNGRHVVIKMMEYWESPDEFFQDIVWQSLIHEEVNKLENSVNVHGYSEYHNECGKHYICFIMDYCDGYQDCFSFIDSCENWSREIKTPYKRKDPHKNDIFYTMERKFKLVAIKNIIKSLESIHSLEIVHGDIKTNNLLINRSTGDVKFIDFGAAIFIEDKRKYMETDWTHGTLGYRAPEENYDNLLGKRSDIYSLAVTIIELWMGDIWYSGETFKQCRNEVLKSLRVIEKNEIELGSFLRKCLNIDGNKRPSIQKIDHFFQNYS